MDERKLSFYLNPSQYIPGVKVVKLFLLIALGALLILRIPKALGHNLVVVHMNKEILPVASRSRGVVLTDEQYRSIALRFRQIQENCPDDARVQYHLGQLAFWSDNYEKTIQELSPCPRGDRSPLARLLRGYAQWNLGQSDEAIQTWRSVPGIASYFLTRASSAEYERDFEAAKEFYELGAMLVQDPTNAQAGYWFAYAMSLLHQDQSPTNIEKVVEQAIRRNPTSFRRQLWLGGQLVYGGRLALAEESLILALDLEPRSHWAMYFRGLLCYKKGDYHCAEQYLRETLSIVPDFVQGVHWLARVLVKTGRKGEALVYYRQAVQLLPGDEQIASELRALEASLQ